MKGKHLHHPNLSTSPWQVRVAAESREKKIAKSQAAAAHSKAADYSQSFSGSAADTKAEKVGFLFSAFHVSPASIQSYSFTGLR